MTGATPVANSDDDANLVLPDGTSLVSGGFAAALSARPDAANGGHLALYATSPDGSGPQRLRNTPGGQLGGMITARDGAMRTAEASIDQLAFDLAGAMNTVHAAGYALDGTSGHDLFATTATAAGAAASLAVDPAVGADPSLLAASSSAGTLPGDGTNLQALIATETQTLSSGMDVSDTVANITARYGTAASGARASSDADTTILDNVSTLRQSVSGVSIDEELVEMQKAQRAYEAIAKVIQTTDAMLETLMSLR
jgi:flagellar hook-associated protein 1 FlgK